MTALDAVTGRQVWRTKQYQVRETIGVSTDSTLILVRTMRDSIVALRAGVGAVEQVWVNNCGFGYDINSASIASSVGTAYYGTKNGLVIALNEKDGSVRWEHRTGVALINTLLPVSADRIVVADMDGVVRLLRARVMR
jgi:outer membrane protein assembly factor BamB